MEENTDSTILLRLVEMTAKRSQSKSDQTNTCPMCRAPVVAEQVICTQCGMNFSTGNVLDTSIEANTSRTKHPRWLYAGLIVMIVLAAMVAWRWVGRHSLGIPPRPMAEIRRDILWQPALYQAPKSGKQIRAPRSAGVVFDKATGELCWPILVCQNPNCPGRQDNQPFRFIAPDPDVKVTSNGELEIKETTDNRIDLDNCPKCLPKRNLDGEFDVNRDQYANWIRPYELPKTAERLKELYVERSRCIEFNRKKQ